MTNNTGKPKKYRKKFQHLNKAGARLHRKDFIDTSYINGVIGVEGEQVIRPLNEAEAEWLNEFYKQAVHGTFKTDEESKLLFKRAKHLSMRKDNVMFFEINGFYPDDVLEAVEAFNKKSKELGNLIWNFWDQREINSDDYKRKTDVHCRAAKGLQLDSFEDVQYIDEEDEGEDTRIEDLITESEE
jgi:hypothetical protein